MKEMTGRSLRFSWKQYREELALSQVLGEVAAVRHDACDTISVRHAVVAVLIPARHTFEAANPLVASVPISLVKGFLAGADPHAVARLAECSGIPRALLAKPDATRVSARTVAK
jgi:hypothetical protein